MGVVYGIDFGAVRSALMIGRPGGALTGTPWVPTAVCRMAGGELVVGAAAERWRAVRPASYRSGLKRDFGSSAPTQLGDADYLPHELAAEVLAHLAVLAEDACPEPPDRVAIAVPAAWDDGLRSLMLDAAVGVGFDRRRLLLVDEPVAAELASRAPDSDPDRAICLGAALYALASLRRGSAHEDDSAAEGGRQYRSGGDRGDDAQLRTPGSGPA